MMVVLILPLVIATVFFSVTQLSTSLPTYLTGASEQASSDLSTTESTATTVQVDQVVTSSGPIAQSLLTSLMDLLVTFGLALVIFFVMISAALAMPTPSRMGLDPHNTTFSRISTLTDDVRKYMTVLTGINFLVGLGNTIFLMILGIDYAVLWGCWRGSWATSPRLDSSLP